MCHTVKKGLHWKFNEEQKESTKNVCSPSVSLSPSDVGGRVDLRCSLLSFHELHVCEGSTIIWMNQTGSELSAKNPQFELQRPTKCVSVLTVEHQSGNHQTFTCQFVKDKQVKTEAVYLLTGKTDVTPSLCSSTALETKNLFRSFSHSCES